MCGIIGEISEKINIDTFIQMRDTLTHRGPDGEGLYINEAQNVALGHRRLSIIDLSELGKQPMTNEDKTIWISFNGEIYNFKTIKEELIKLNHRFRSKTDTEVIIHGYEEWGIKILEKLRGMFAFGIWDENKKQLFLARDRIGIKPLYYYYDKKRFIFASELKAIVKDKSIKRTINPEALKYFFFKGYVPHPYAIWENMYKLPPAHYMIFRDNHIYINKYWSLKLSNKISKELKALNCIRNILTESIKLRFMSDVPLGVLLSGGIDSSTVCALGSEINNNLLSFSIGFDLNEYSELKYAQKVVDHLKIKNTSKNLSLKYIQKNLDKILYHYDEPFGAKSIFPTFLLMETVGKELKVVLSGDGGDETFAGYKRYEAYEKYRKFRTLIPLSKVLLKITSNLSKILNNRHLNRFFNTAKRHLKLLVLDNLDRFITVSDTYFPLQEINKLLNFNLTKKISNVNFLEKYFDKSLNNIKDVMYLDINTYLVDHILTKVDRASMAHSVEVRVPFLDHFLLEYVMSIDKNLIFKEKKKKYLLKKISKKILPSEIISRKKKGFGAPLDKLGFIEDYKQVLDDSLTVKDDLIDRSFCESVVRNYKKSRSSKYQQIWLLIIFELWYRKWKSS